MMVGQLLVLLISACLLPINFGFVAATGNSNRPDYCSVSRNIPMASTTTTTDDDVDDVDDFHQYAAAAVDLSNAHVSESGFLSSKCFLLSHEYAHEPCSMQLTENIPPFF